jgi:N utilization substance protein A
MAKLVLRALRSTVRTAVQEELKSDHVIRVRVNPETGVEIYAEFEVVDKVTNPETELTLDEARGLLGEKAQLGSKFLRRIHSGVDSVRVIAQAANQFLQQG